MATQPHPMFTPEGWDATAEEYDAINVKDVNFTPKYGKDLFYYSMTGHINSDEKEVIEHIKSLSSAKILDVAGGSGPLVMEVGRILAKCNHSNGKILGTDFSPKMVEIMGKNIKQENLQTFAECKVMDGMALDISDNTIDFAYSVFGVMLFPQPVKGLSEMYRVLCPGGKVGVATWTQNHAIPHFHNAVLQKVLGSAPAFTPSLGTVEQMTEALKSCGFQDIKIQATTHTAEFGNAQKYLRMMENNPGFGLLKQKLGVEGWQKYQQEAEKMFQEKYPNYSMSCEALLAVATK